MKSTNFNRSFFDQVQVTFVGNSGFLIVAGDRKVLIDAFFEGFPLGYTLPANVRDLLVKAQPPFDHVDLILATHAHGDHFSAAMLSQYLQTIPNTVFVSTTQATSQLPCFGERVIAADPVESSPVNLEVNGIRVEAIYMSHGYPPNDPKEIFNNAYIVTLNGITFFHTGDIADLQDVNNIIWQINTLIWHSSSISIFSMTGLEICSSTTSEQPIYSRSIINLRSQYLTPMWSWPITRRQSFLTSNWKKGD